MRRFAHHIDPRGPSLFFNPLPVSALAFIVVGCPHSKYCCFLTIVTVCCSHPLHCYFLQFPTVVPSPTRSSSIFKLNRVATAAGVGFAVTCFVPPVSARPCILPCCSGACLKYPTQPPPLTYKVFALGIVGATLRASVYAYLQMPVQEVRFETALKRGCSVVLIHPPFTKQPISTHSLVVHCTAGRTGDRSGVPPVGKRLRQETLL